MEDIVLLIYFIYVFTIALKSKVEHSKTRYFYNTKNWVTIL